MQAGGCTSGWPCGGGGWVFLGGTAGPCGSFAGCSVTTAGKAPACGHILLRCMHEGLPGLPCMRLYRSPLAMIVIHSPGRPDIRAAGCFSVKALACIPMSVSSCPRHFLEVLPSTTVHSITCSLCEIHYSAPLQRANEPSQPQCTCPMTGISYGSAGHLHFCSYCA